MGRRKWIVLIGAGMIVAATHWFSLSFHPRAALRGRTARKTNAAESSGTAVPSFDRPSTLALGGAMRPNLLEEAWAQRLLEDSDPTAIRSLEEGMRLLGSGSWAEARSLFERLVESYPRDKTKALATWAIGLTYLSEGGTHNLHQAANQFIRFRDAYGSDKDLEELVRAAMIDIPVVSIDLMRYAPSEYERTHAADLAQKTLKAFLERWPDDPQAPAARAALADVESFINQAAKTTQTSKDFF